MEDHGSGSRTTQTRLEAMEHRLLEQLDTKMASLQPPPGLAAPDVPENNAQAVAIAELQAQNQKFSSWFNDVGTRFCGLESRLSSQQTQIEQLQASVQQQTAQIHSLQNALDGLNQSFRLELQSCMGSQTARLEALIEKRAKTS